MSDAGTSNIQEFGAYAPWAEASSGGGGGGGTSQGAGLSAGMFGSFAAAAGDFANAFGSMAEAGAYKEAAVLATNDAQIAKASGAIQTYNMQRKINLSTGGQMAEEGGASFSMQGSAADVRRGSFAQGALAKQLIGTQTAINVNNYTQEAASATAMATAASDAAIGGIIGGVFQTAGGIAQIPGI